MKTSRRNLLRVGLGALPVISFAGTIPAFVSQMAFAKGAKRGELSNDNILVALQLTGGNDGLNTVIPFGDDAYYKARPKIGVAKNAVVKLDDHFGLNPGLAPLKQLFDQGKLAVINGCGYPSPSRSHFRSMEIWHTANPKSSQTTGWLGHYLDHAARGSAPVMALNIGAELPQALVNEGAPVPSIEKLDDFRLKSNPATARGKLERDLVMEMNKATDSQSPAQKFLARQATNAILATEKVHDVSRQNPSNFYYGNEPMATQLQLISSLIAANSGTRLFYLQTNGFDTHANQVETQERLFSGVAQALSAFQQDLASKGLAEKVMVMVFSEFGRRVAENSSAGTDHGAAAPMFVLGGKVKAGIYGKMPSLTDLDDGDLKFTTDFRRVYATILDKWLNAESGKVLEGKFEPVGFL